MMLALVPVVIGLVEAVKFASMPSKFAPLVSLALGVLGALVVPHVGMTAGMAAIGGLVVGLSASGLYAGTKAVVA